MIRLAAAFLVALLAAAPVAAQPRLAPMPPANYNLPDNWLCLPGRADACNVDLSATNVYARGNTRLETFRLPRRQPDIDCFYVYPTVSNDDGILSDLTPNAEERRVVASQFARFAQSCRLFAPMYRQITLGTLRQAMAGGDGLGGLRGLTPQGGGGGYNDVRDAFRAYMANFNNGRGFVLIGHSQGSGVLTRLIQEEIEGAPLADYMVSAILLGTNVEVPEGARVGGTFRFTPICEREYDTGCIITYSSFRATIPPGPDALFGQASRPGMVTACTNPANMSRGQGEPDAYLSAYDTTGPAPNWTGDIWEPVGTPFVKVPGLLETACVRNSRGAYLAVLVDGEPRDARIDDIPGDVMGQNGLPNAAWGLHLIDMNLHIGDLVDIVERQGRSWNPPRRR